MKESKAINMTIDWAVSYAQLAAKQSIRNCALHHGVERRYIAKKENHHERTPPNLISGCLARHTRPQSTPPNRTAQVFGDRSIGMDNLAVDFRGCSARRVHILLDYHKTTARLFLDFDCHLGDG